MVHTGRIILPDPDIYIGWKERRMRSRYNSSSPVNYKKGKEITLYRDLDSGRILERGPKLSMLTGGIILILISVIGAISTLDVLGIL